MKSSITFSVFGLFALVLASYMYLNPPNKSTLPAGKSESMRLMNLDQGDEIHWLQIQNVKQNTLLTLEKEEKGWKIKFPVADDADSLMADSLATALLLSFKARRLTPQKSWQEYGLEKPEIKIGIETKNEEGRRYLSLGDKSPVGEFVYARWEGESEYFLLDQNLKSAFDRSVYSLRMKKIFRTPLTDVVSVRIRTSREEYEITQQEGKWFWMEPIPILGEDVSREQLNEMMMMINDLFVKDFVDEEKLKKDRRKLGFSLTSPMIRISAKDESSEVIYFGKEEAKRDALYARRDGSDSIFFVAQENVRKLLSGMETIAQEVESKREAEKVSTENAPVAES